MKRALSFSQAREKGLVYSDYSYQNVPEKFVATIEYKVWGKRMNLQFYVITDEGERYLISIFRNHTNSLYTPTEMREFDLSSKEIQPGMKMEFSIKYSNKKVLRLVSARLIHN